MGLAIPVGVNPASIGVSVAWWLDAARAIEAHGLRTAWIWDHFVSRGRLTDPVLECWTMLTAAAMVTERVRLGPFVTNVMNRHPAVLARSVATLCELSGGRVELGMGIGGHPAEHEAYGIPFPPARERAEHLEEAIAVTRALLSGGPADFEGRHYRLTAAHAFPAPDPQPRIVVAGTTPAGARLAARLGDAWTCFDTEYERLAPVFLEALAAAGRKRSEVAVLVGVEAESAAADLPGMAAAWAERGVDEIVVHEVRPAVLPAVLASARSAAGGT
jgi:alkanesulfonate monooxygenase SsuD/methylene tetrahydromethanopterin reductase-like flavin-dependent oxidoreductase (luciferase family)